MVYCLSTLDNPDSTTVEDLDTAAVGRYLDRIGLDPETVRATDRDVALLSRLQTAHVRTVPFENLAIIGDPHRDRRGAGITLQIDHLYEKVVERERGGFCYELNGLFTCLLDALGFDVDRGAASILGTDGEPTMPANHHTILVDLDGTYIVDVGILPAMVSPTPRDGGESAVDPLGGRWRVVDNDRPSYRYTVEYRTPEAEQPPLTHGDGGEWEGRYVFDPTPRDLSYFQATCDYLANAPESWFTSDTIIHRMTEEAHLQLGEEAFTRIEPTGRTEHELTVEEWHDVLEREFGLSLTE